MAFLQLTNHIVFFFSALQYFDSMDKKNHTKTFSVVF